MRFVGALQKMQTMIDEPVRYALNLGDDLLSMNQLLNRKINLGFKHKHICFCGLEVDKVYRSNFCYECYFSKPQAGEAIFRPELSKAHLGQADRDLEFEKAYQLQPHVVYLANSGGLKVGVTRARQMQHRWMDQGANEAIVLAETPNRFLAGRIEVALKNHVSDKTNWRNMLRNELAEVDLALEKNRLAKELEEDLSQYVVQNNTIYSFTYPVLKSPEKIKSINLLKVEQAAGVLAGIKGQYLIFEDGHVMNVRSHEGYLVDLEVA